MATEPAAAAPTVSVVIPAYNAAWCIERALESVFAQDYKDFEVVVVNDGSTDDTAAVLARFGESIRIITKKNAGLACARNTGLDAARGRYAAFLDADDWWLPAKLGRQVALMEANPRVGFCSTAARVQDSNGRLLNVWECPASNRPLLERLFHENAAVAGSGSGVMVRRELIRRTGGFDASLKSLEDIDMWMRLAAVTEYSCIAEPLTVLLRHSDSMSRNLDVMRDSALRVMHKNRGLLPCRLRGSFWRAAVAGVHADYAKWRYRNGQRLAALREVAHLFARAPIRRGRLGLGLLRDIVLARQM